MLKTWQQTFGSSTGRALSSRGERLLGQLLDGLVIFGLAFLGEFAVARAYDLEGWPLVVAALPAIFYYFLADALPGGQSLGKRLLDMKVIDAETGEPCSFAQSFVRNLILFVGGPVDWVFILGERHQRLGDRAAGTLVVDSTK